MKTKAKIKRLCFQYDDVNHRCESLEGEILYDNYIKIDHSEHAPDAVVRIIKEHFPFQKCGAIAGTLCEWKQSIAYAPGRETMDTLLARKAKHIENHNALFGKY